MSKKYTLRYLPLFKENLTAAYDCLAVKLKNQKASQDF